MLMRGRFDRFTIALIVGLMVLLIACGSAERPRLLPIGPSQPSSNAQGTPTPEQYMTGRWLTAISETQSQETDGILVSVKQLRFSTPERLLPSYVSEGMDGLGVGDAQSIVLVHVNVNNNTGRDFEFDPAGSNAVLRVNSEEARPAKPLSNVKGRVPAGGQRSFVITFPLKQNTLGDFQELTYSVRGHDFRFTDLRLSPPL